MTRLYKPAFIFLVVTLPQVVLLAILSRIYTIINTELSRESILTWQLLASYLIIALSVYSIYGIYSVIKKREVHTYLAVSIAFIYSLFIALFMFNQRELIPSAIPNWMLFGISPVATLLTLTMPALLYSLIITVHWLSKKYCVDNLSKEVGILIGIPVGWYILFHFAAAIDTSISFAPIFEKLVYFLFIASAVVFFFLLVRIIYHLLSKKVEAWQKYFSWIVIIGSISGLALNEALGNIFGDFSHWGYYLLAFITGLIVGIPAEKYPKYKLLIFFTKGLTFAYSLYFFLVFLPYLPLSIIGVVFMGFGLLMLIPLLLMALHVKALLHDYNFLKNQYNKPLLMGIFIIGLLIIPTTVVASVSKDKYHIDNALSHVYQRSYGDSTGKDINIEGIKRVLKNIKDQSMDNRDFFSTNKKTPFISNFYNSYVLDGLTLSMDKISYMEAIFFGNHYENLNDSSFVNGNPTILLEAPSSETYFDEEEGTYKSWIHLELTNTADFQNEYITYFHLPEGSYISDYYLYVFEEKKYGLMADKRAANWIYNQIRAIRRDPGILTYVGDNTIEFKVFPFAPKEKRRTGIEITHKAPITIEIDNRQLKLKDVLKNNRVVDSGEIEGVAYITKEEKSKLNGVVREAEYYFILDHSQNSKGNSKNYISRVKNFIEEKGIEDRLGEIIAANYQEEVLSYKANWEEELEKQDYKGGFYVDYTIKRVLYDHYVNHKKTLPVFVVVTDEINNIILQNDFDRYEFISPEGLSYFHLNGDGNMVEYSLIDKTKEPQIVEDVSRMTVLEWEDNEGKSYYLPDNHEDSIVITDFVMNGEEIIEGSKWQRGLMLKSLYRRSLLQPEKAFEASLNIVKESIKGRVMSPLTSFIVLETEAQEKTMLEKQKQLLSATKPLDLDSDNFTQMNEPNIMILLMILSIILISRRFYQLKIKQ
ncbi:MSEP-CTERM sorting domain-containing protein [Alkaliphilus serpentinus]|uniref:MSEP-CTERM sorting domain-containing protein n=1 Tax=Alkaliphilus serpentinus TaxID=1482731 RepID=A0A833HQ84_9FIRM|nr:MSEP-CTERM sorting domain-containing protein [Alkaliphilus serpentinus]KAB3531538.1 MSEP-CTERM sorting domain-containing protein [Alkaliphilus serpentinus]